MAITMHFVEAKGILSAHNGIEPVQTAAHMAVFTVTVEVNVTGLPMTLKISK